MAVLKLFGPLCRVYIVQASIAISMGGERLAALSAGRIPAVALSSQVRG